jgi:hypothetical protein
LNPVLRHGRNVLAVVGLLGILGLAYVATVDWVFGSLSEKSVLQEVVNSEGSAKATLYRVDAGASAATRTYVALSNAKVDGSKKGNVILTLLHTENSGRTSLEWKSDRLLIVHSPEDVEYFVTKTRGITIEIVPD